MFNEAGADKDIRIEGDTEANLFFADASTNRIGIGTAAPGNTLHVYGSGNIAKLQGSSGTEASMAFTPASGNAWQLGAGPLTANSFQLYENTAAAARITVLEGGNVGIGVAAPTDKLQVNFDAASQTCGITVLNTRTDGNGSAVRFNSCYCSGIRTHSAINGNADGVGGALSFHTSADNSALTRHMIIKPDGKVGIGTSDPDSKLHVNKASAGTLTASIYGDVFTIEDDGSNGMSIMTPDDAYGQILWASPTSGGGLGNTNARMAGGYTSGAPRLDISVGACNNMVTFWSTGAVSFSGAVSKGSGSFRIKHPLESRDGHDLVHSFVEGPQADLIYRGVTQLVDGSAEINVDTEAGMTEGTFAVLNRCTQVFTTNESNWDAVRGSIEGNTLTIESNVADSTACISWMVVGERQDDHMYDTEWTDSDGRVIIEPETMPPVKNY